MSVIDNIHWESIGPKVPSDDHGGPTPLRNALAQNESLPDFLARAAAAREAVVLIVNDSHRATQTRKALAALAGVLKGLPQPPRFRTLVATGAHQFSVQERRAFEAATFGEGRLDIEEVAWHDAGDAACLADIAGVRMHRWLATERWLLPIGSVEPHYFAGVTGAHKTVTIGCMACDDIARNHAGAMDPASDVLQLNGNPVYDGIVAILAALKGAGNRLCAINEVVCGDSLLAAAVGDPLGTMHELLPIVRRVFLKQVTEPMDLLRLKVPWPLGRNLYQADKALKNNHRAVRDGGGILLEAECGDGVGPDAFLSLLRRAESYAEARLIVTQEGYRLSDHKAVKLRYLTDPAGRDVHVALVSAHVSAPDAEAAGMNVFPEAAAAIEWLSGVVAGPLERGLIVEDAGVVSVTAAGPRNPHSQTWSQR